MIVWLADLCGFGFAVGFAFFTHFLALLAHAFAALLHLCFFGFELSFLLGCEDREELFVDALHFCLLGITELLELGLLIFG